MEKPSFSPDDLPYDPIEEQKKRRGDKLSNQKKNEILKEKGLYKDKRMSALKIFGNEYFFNYELSWLKFNERVLAEAQNEKNKILERVKFIGIVCSNLDEYFQKRVGGLKRQIHAGVKSLSVDGMTAHDQLEAVRQVVKKMIEDYRTCFFDDLKPELEKIGICIQNYDELTDHQKSIADKFFLKDIYPIVTPLAVDESHPFPFISNHSLSFAVELRNPQTKENSFARIKIPSNRKRFVQVFRRGSKVVLVPIEDIIRQKMESFFPGMEILSAHLFRVTRNASLERNEEEADDLLEVIEDELRERKFASIVRLELEKSMPEHIKKYLYKNLNVTKKDVYEMEGMIGLVSSFEIASISGFSSYKIKNWSPVLHPALSHPLDEDPPSMFDVIKKHEFMVHHPYHSFELSTQRFIEEAASDPKVLAIKQTLYRTSKDSPLMHALMRAAESGKQVAVLVEIKARFDEEQNIQWAQQLDNYGVHVAYGIPGLKIHTKLTMVVREEEDGLKTYCHIGTGNYHPGTAQLYEDLGVFTCDEVLASDVTDVFNLLTGYAPGQTFEKLIVAPKHMRPQMEAMVDFETNEARAGRPSRIIAKMNSLEDPRIIQKLYEASQAGVEIDLIVRGVCRLIPGKENLSENIRVYSVIGRFLEHSRIFYFHHAGEHIYALGSADWMHRNLDNRVEAVLKVEKSELKKYLQFLLSIYLKDNQQRWVLNTDGSYQRVEKKKGERKVATHKVLMNHMADSVEPIPIA
ncbi:MAG: polyphosphate kinase 1 [Balneolaceae bacterium]|nr:polyphosphate kinase 1 [Balneolaceae bacterium]